MCRWQCPRIVTISRQLPSFGRSIFFSSSETMPRGNQPNVLVHGQYVLMKKGTKSGDDVVMCKHCKKHQLKRKADRMEKHLIEECQTIPEATKKAISSNYSNKHRRYSAPEGACSSSVGQIASRTLFLSEKQIEELKRKQALFIITSGSSFNVVKNYWYHQIFESLGIANVVPDRQVISGPILNRLYMDAKAENKLILDGESHRNQLMVLKRASF